MVSPAGEAEAAVEGLWMRRWVGWQMLERERNAVFSVEQSERDSVDGQGKRLASGVSLAAHFLVFSVS